MATFITDSITGDILQLDATMNVSMSSSGSLTKNPILGGKTSASDHYIHDQDTYTISGWLTGIKSKNTNSEYVTSPSSYIATLQDIKDNVTPVTVTAFNRKGGFLSSDENVLQPATDCYITNFKVEKSAGERSRDLQVTITLVKALLSEQSEVVAKKVAAPSFANDATELTDGVGGTKQASQRDTLQTSNYLTGNNVFNVGTGG